MTAILSLSKRGLSLLRAKRAIEGLLETGGVTIQLPMVEDLTALTDELFHIEGRRRESSWGGDAFSPPHRHALMDVPCHHHER